MSELTHKPTPAELSILQVLWRQGRSTVRDVHETLKPERDTGYTTMLKLMQIMAEKGLVRRFDGDPSGRAHVFEAAITQDQTERVAVRDMVDRVFEGAANRLVLHALADKSATREEIAEIRRLLDTIEEESR